MFIGHFAVGLAAKRVSPQMPLGAAVLGAQWADLVWPLFVTPGWERMRLEPGNTVVTPLAFDHYPWSHSLLMLSGWGALLGGGWWWRRDWGAVFGWALVLSHWELDWIRHGPDMPLAPELETRTGLGLLNSLPATLAVEGLMFAGGPGLYPRAAPTLEGKRRWVFWGLIAFLVVIYVANLFGPPPPSAGMMAYFAFALGTGVVWGYLPER
jgi:hypothetical protein